MAGEQIPMPALLGAARCPARPHPQRLPAQKRVELPLWFGKILQKQRSVGLGPVVCVEGGHLTVSLAVGIDVREGLDPLARDRVRAPCVSSPSA